MMRVKIRACEHELMALPPGLGGLVVSEIICNVSSIYLWNINNGNLCWAPSLSLFKVTDKSLLLRATVSGAKKQLF